MHKGTSLTQCIGCSVPAALKFKWFSIFQRSWLGLWRYKISSNRGIVPFTNQDNTKASKTFPPQNTWREITEKYVQQSVAATWSTGRIKDSHYCLVSFHVLSMLELCKNTMFYHFLSTWGEKKVIWRFCLFYNPCVDVITGCRLFAFTVWRLMAWWNAGSDGTFSA